MFRFAWLLPILLAAPLLLTACGNDNANSNTTDDKLQVVTTLPLFADFVRNVGGDRVEVTSLLPLGADPHTFEPSPRDVEPITKADIAFANGLDLEPSLIKVLETNLPDDAELVLLGDIVQPEVVSPDNPSIRADTLRADPHMWMDTENAERYAKIVEEELTSRDLDSAAFFHQSYSEYADELAQLRIYIDQKIDPISDLKLVTTHEAFDWFAMSLPSERKAVSALARSPGQEPSPNEIAALTAAIKDQNIPAVFSEPQISEESHILEQAAADAGVQVCTLYSDSLDDEVSTYIEMMRFNADELARCLGGDNGN
jgi:ABC-type Zn uptake system ZnuABC Zn-binding protein ZnuA